MSPSEIIFNEIFYQIFSSRQCTWCGTAHLCSEEHLRLHRPHTKCFPFRLANIEGAGRGLVTTRAVRARETVLTESAGVAGPGLLTPPVCPSCLAPVKPPLLPCSRCSLPVCSPACQAEFSTSMSRTVTRSCYASNLMP